MVSALDQFLTGGPARLPTNPADLPDFQRQIEEDAQARGSVPRLDPTRLLEPATTAGRSVLQDLINTRNAEILARGGIPNPWRGSAGPSERIPAGEPGSADNPYVRPELLAQLANPSGDTSINAVVRSNSVRPAPYLSVGTETIHGPITRQVWNDATRQWNYEFADRTMLAERDLVNPATGLLRSELQPVAAVPTVPTVPIVPTVPAVSEEEQGRRAAAADRERLLGIAGGTVQPDPVDEIEGPFAAYLRNRGVGTEAIPWGSPAAGFVRSRYDPLQDLYGLQQIIGGATGRPTAETFNQFASQFPTATSARVRGQELLSAFGGLTPEQRAEYMLLTEPSYDAEGNLEDTGYDPNLLPQLLRTGLRKTRGAIGAGYLSSLVPGALERYQTLGGGDYNNFVDYLFNKFNLDPYLGVEGSPGAAAPSWTPEWAQRASANNGLGRTGSTYPVLDPEQGF
jgi:hypothetical protein